MLERTTEHEDKLNSLIIALGKDADTWEDWHALYFFFPSIETEAILTTLGDVATLFSTCLCTVDGFMMKPSENGILVVCQSSTSTHLTETALQGIELVLAQTNEMPGYELYNLAHDSECFIRMCYTRFSADSCKTNPWVPPAHLVRFCRDDYARDIQTTETLGRHTRVLLVEDDPVTRWLVRNALKDQCELLTAGTAGKAISLYQTFKPDLVFLDIGLPDQNGDVVLDDIIAHDPAARVVMFTHDNHFDTITNMMTRGAAGFVTKPFHRSRLLQYLA